MPQAQANMGLQAYYYDNYTQDNLYNDAPPIPPTTSMVASIPVATVDQDFDLYPVAGLTEDFVVKYEGYITATESGTANLQCLADDGCIVIIDGVTIINEWWDKGTSGDVYQYTLVPNQSLPITVWYYENGGGAVIQLRWQLENQDWAVVPEAVFSTAPKLITVVDVPSETQTVVVEESVTVPSAPVETTTSDSQNQSNDSSSVVVETSTQTFPVVDSSTSPTTTDSGSVIVAPHETQTSTSESSTQTIPSETPTAPTQTPLPTPIPVVEPQPIPLPVPPAPLPEPQPQPEPVEPSSPDPDAPETPVVEETVPQDPVTEEVPQTEEQPAPEEQLPVEEPQPTLPEETENNVPNTDDPQEQPLVTPQPVPQPVVEPEPTSPPDTAPETPMVTLDNGVIIAQDVVEALEVLDNPAELLSELFTDPSQVLLALSNIGADMSPEARQKSQDAVVQAVIVGSIVQSAASAVAHRRKP